MRFTSIKEIVEEVKKNPIESNGDIYHPIPFEGFESLKTSSKTEAVQSKYTIIQNALIQKFNSLDKLRLLDLGANAGFYTFSLVKEGASATAFEPLKRYSEIADFIIKRNDLKVTWHPQTFNKALVEDKKFDTALMLSMFQWMADGGKNIDEACENLKVVSEKCSSLVFELGYNTGASCLKTSKLNHYAELISFLKKNTSYKYFKYLGVSKLWKSGKRYIVFCSNDPSFDDTGFKNFQRKITI